MRLELDERFWDFGKMGQFPRNRRHFEPKFRRSCGFWMSVWGCASSFDRSMISKLRFPQPWWSLASGGPRSRQLPDSLCWHRRNGGCRSRWGAGVETCVGWGGRGGVRMRWRNDTWKVGKQTRKVRKKKIFKFLNNGHMGLWNKWTKGYVREEGSLKEGKEGWWKLIEKRKVCSYITFILHSFIRSLMAPQYLELVLD